MTWDDSTHHSRFKIHPQQQVLEARVVAEADGVQPVGPVYTFEDADVEHIGLPLSEIRLVTSGQLPQAG